MRILIVTQTFPLNPTDGTAHFMYDLTNGFKAAGHEVSVLLPFHPQLETAKYNGTTIYPFKYIWPDRWSLLGYGRTLENDQRLKWYCYLLIPFYIFSGITKLRKIVDEKQIQRIYVFWVIPNGILVYLSGMRKIPVYMVIPGSDVFIALSNPIIEWITRRALGWATGIISNSAQLLTDLKVIGRVIPYGAPVNRGKRKKNRSIVVATAGRPVEKKGITRLKLIYPEVCVLSGMTIEEFRRQLLSVDIFLAMSVRDSRGNLDDGSLTVLEAMAAGCTVIASDLPGYRIWITPGVNGYLLNPDRPEEWRKLITKLIRSPQLLARVGKAARKTVRNKFTPVKIARLMEPRI